MASFPAITPALLCGKIQRKQAGSAVRNNNTVNPQTEQRVSR
jgi:hypothetical protein